MACLVTRDGGMYSKVVTSDGLVVTGPPEGGLILDGLRSCLGFPVAGTDGLAGEAKWAGLKWPAWAWDRQN